MTYLDQIILSLAEIMTECSPEEAVPRMRTRLDKVYAEGRRAAEPKCSAHDCTGDVTACWCLRHEKERSDLYEKGRRAGLEEAAITALEQRCERMTGWDMACIAIAAKIRAPLVPRRRGHGI